jgi:outer membrane receptor protein involved in Fe transport
MLMTGTALVSATSAYADEKPETVVVTGSRIATTDAISAAPISIVTNENIVRSKSVTLDQVLSRMPEIGQQGTNDQNSIQPGGINSIDLRYLKPQRTLVLINGQRMVNTYTSGLQAADIQNIPVAMVDHIEVLRDGASPIYGADAIAGVVNIITREDFEGLQLDAGAGISTVGDHFTKQLSATVGATGANSGVIASLSWYTEDPVYQRTRDWAHGVVAFSSAVPTGAYFPKIDGSTVKYCGTADGQIKKGGCAPFDTGAEPEIIQGRSVINASLSGHYDFSSNIQAFGEAFFTDRKSTAVLNPEPIGSTYPSAKYLNGTQIGEGNPNNPFGQELPVRKRLFEVGDRQFNQIADTFQVRSGLKGKFGSDWTWDAAVQYGESNTSSMEANAINLTHMVQLTGLVPCLPDAPAGCGTVNLAGLHALTPAQASYVRYTSQETSHYAETLIYGDVTGSLPLTLPGGAIGAAGGFDWRREVVRSIPDSLKQNGDDAEGFVLPTEGHYDVAELYGELNFPVLKNQPFAQELSFDLAGRASDYSNFGWATVYKGGMNWAILDAVRFRANYGTGVRAPQVASELFYGASQSANGFTDPCVGASNPVVVANCSAQIPNYTPATFQQSVPQLSANVIGNAKLKPETSNQYNLGLVFTPSEWISNFSLSVDYYNIHINHRIDTIDPGVALDACYKSVGLSSSFCAPFGARDTAVYQISTYQQPYLNLGYVHTDGIDFDLNYNTTDWTSWAGLADGTVFGVSAQATYLDNYIEETAAGTIDQYSGTWRSTAVSTAYPKWKANLTASLTVPSGMYFAYTGRFVGAATSHDYISGGRGPADDGTFVPGLFFSDIAVQVPYEDNYVATFGVDNLFDKDPPLAADNYVQTISNQYDFVGRYFYLKLSAKY